LNKCLRMTCLVAVAVSVPALAADPVHNPYPKKIAPSKVKAKFSLFAKDLVAPIRLMQPNADAPIVVVDQIGGAILFRGKDRTTLIDVRTRLAKLRSGFDERGLLGLAFHPDFSVADSKGFGAVYTYTSEPVGKSKDFTFSGSDAKVDHQSVVAEWRLGKDSTTVDPSTRRELMRIDQPQFNHNGGCLAFGPDKMLYISFGDGGKASDTGPGHGKNGNGQNLNTVHGTILRIDPLGASGAKSKNGHYSIPADNPFVGKDGIDEIWAYGLRNPWVISFDPKGRLIVADVGQGKIEEINIVTRGGNYGWPIMEANFLFDRSTTLLTKPDKLPANMIGPVAAYDHDEGVSISGGVVYRGSAFPELKGLYICGDWISLKNKNGGRLFVANLETGEVEELLVGGGEPPFHVTGVFEDAAGEVYVLGSTAKGPSGKKGVVVKLVPAK
jgi:glucose/arabinose dehydrogenase